MDLPAIWFLLVGFLFAAYTVLDGFDLGIGVLFPVLGRTPAERRTLLRMLAPVWDGNEVWLLAGAMALFGAFPDVYATVFSGFYLALILVLVGLILRAVSFEFWSLESRHRKAWDIAFILGSLLPALLLPVALGNVIVGVPIAANREFAGDFFTLLRPFPLALGLFGLLVILLQGTGYAAMKTVGAMQGRAYRLRRLLSLAFLPFLIAVAVLTVVEVPSIAEKPLAWVAVAIVLAFWGASFLAARRGDDRGGFFLSSLMVLGLWGVVGAYQFPNLVTASNDPALSLTAYNAASGESTLATMLAVALIGLPVVLLYTVYAYRVFKGRLPVTA
jgi:cytochrome d ubiquinol oxidase subunit II